ncbi:glycoside hydrolase family 5 protein [Conidiobolus coronatus NRRL 28638]|uniref:glucan 1,3-beta-glucosidase n=1 Tax=Conidiobolus coronatus (strain ATCC 28846 / CBS 209.66 / NRRL 28638) TaxID=796925 RepID=A0A137PA49_CONC2|nr:glycoside hydrolase family 5 protein [Conidiobolus coronatus NRRL 28638]|eukprot:KXN71889.1 glycoside hydrolase family 5 protein [Conidiobolus coronatus NRRL 28638]
MFGVLNEPAIYLTNNTEGVRQWYKDSYNVIRNNGTEGPALVFHEGFLGIKKWQGFMPNNTYKRVTIDTHNYLIFDKDLVRLPLADQVSFPCKSWKPDFIESDSKFGWTMCGEFSVATNDCGYWLNGVGLGARYEGTYQLEPGPAACPTCTCKNDGDYKSFSTDKKNLLLRFMELQMDAFEQSLGWFFWNFKTENHVNPFWDYFLALDQGWAPKDASQRTNKC